jgi:hypothetical protein
LVSITTLPETPSVGRQLAVTTKWHRHDHDVAEPRRVRRGLCLHSAAELLDEPASVSGPRELLTAT